MTPLHNNCLITLSDVEMRYSPDDVALRNVNLCVDKGDFMAISGPNGGGKTTLLKILLKLQNPTSGNVQYWRDGKPVKHLSIGYLPQKSSIDLRFPITVKQTVLSGLLSGWALKVSHSDEERLDEVAQLLGLQEFLNKQIGELSGGQLQRTLIARAIISQPELVVLDEPLSYVDKQFEKQIYSLVEDLSRRATIVLVSHEMTVISSMANRHIIVDKSIAVCPHTHHTPALEN